MERRGGVYVFMIFWLALMICMVVFGQFLGISDLYVCKFYCIILPLELLL